VTFWFIYEYQQSLLLQFAFKAFNYCSHVHFSVVHLSRHTNYWLSWKRFISLISCTTLHQHIPWSFTAGKKNMINHLFGKIQIIKPENILRNTVNDLTLTKW